MQLLGLGAFVSVALCVTALEAQKINGWYPCSLRTFAKATPTLGPVVFDALGSSLGRVGDHKESSIASFFPSLKRGMSISTGASPPTRSAEGAEVTMALCHDGICKDATNATVMIFLKRLRANNTNTTGPKKTLWMLHGGPGASSVANHRDTGRSSRLTCSATQIETSGSPYKGEITVDNFATCAQDISIKLGDNGDSSMLATYSTTSAATDLSKLVSLLDKGKESCVYGVSFGTYLVERLMQFVGCNYWVTPKNLAKQIFFGEIANQGLHFGRRGLSTRKRMTAPMMFLMGKIDFENKLILNSARMTGTPT
ncbi:Aste57867_2804 [Aphanomyces stellatus]|uniref:Aste57867_2804 protein n=1 Tax=Aphanomyces stellatus TaxID=120398 RepID=A0A485KDK0_9STRA|nr:hypothetical protein As57867_002797 [Aphanomyces stellatus]VFT79993.1 Aste57867_2804 [Aphanomyces stellatus]